MSEKLKDKLSRVSNGPGVYIMKNADGQVIYVGKARNLKSRLATYFIRNGHTDAKTNLLKKQIDDFETILTPSEQEALLLESNLIKRHRPKYNVILKDDKRYPVLRLDTGNPYPNLTVVRKIENDDAIYFGPYSSAAALNKTVNIINKTFKLRKCRAAKFTNRTRPCLHCQMNRCLAPCCLDVDTTTYGDMVKEVILFLNGRTPELIKKIKIEMISAAEKQAFERAASLRDKLFALERVLEKQAAVTSDRVDRDVVGLARTEQWAVITLLFVRGGYLLGSRHFEFKETFGSDADIIDSFLWQYYERAPLIPKEILIPRPVENATLHEERLTKTRGKRVMLRCPQRGEKVRLTKMAADNAENRLREMIAAALSDQQLLDRLRRRLRLSRSPHLIECFDNSNLSGKHPVSGMVVFKDGKAHKSAYRKYALNMSTPDDYAYMAEVLSRRFGKKSRSETLPDLLMVDGGKGQLNIALNILTSLGLETQMDVLGIAKKEKQMQETQDKIFLPGRANPINFGKDGDLLLFLQRVRDEAHRYAVSFHRQRRRVSAIASELDKISGVGKKRKQILLKHFGSVKKIRDASLDEINAVPGLSRSVAENIQNRLSKKI
ncbi:MAG: excinuclease ABC subunit UvrC [Deltaproteobacteria bacterium]|nr:excinuclease ABC subunit UvrC [Deltaproteobacteria bacterium]